jgi:hypothetical protein
VCGVSTAVNEGCVEMAVPLKKDVHNLGLGSGGDGVRNVPSSSLNFFSPVAPNCPCRPLSGVLDRASLRATDGLTARLPDWWLRLPVVVARGIGALGSSGAGSLARVCAA